MKLVFSDQAWKDYQYWVNTNDKVRDRINELIKQCKRTPFKGTGKPEPLKGDLTGWWSRRISQEDRMVYRVSGAGDGQSLRLRNFGFITEFPVCCPVELAVNRQERRKDNKRRSTSKGFSSTASRQFYFRVPFAYAHA